MNLSETLQLLDKLNAVGARHFKSPDLEVTLIAQQPYATTGLVTVSNQPPVEPPPEPPHNQDNTQKVQELIDLLKMKDEQLVNTIFPAGA